MEHPGSLLRGLQRNSRAAAELSQEKLNKLLDQMQHLPNAHRFQALQEMLGQLGPSQRLDLLHEMLEVKLTHHERLKFMEDPEIVGYFFEYAHDQPRRDALASGFAHLKEDDKIELMEEFMATIPMNRRSEALKHAWQGTGDEEQAPALSLMLRSARPEVRRSAFTLLNFSPEDFPVNERQELLKLGTPIAGLEAAVQTDLSVEEIIAKAEAVTAAAAAAEAAEEANWETRAAERRKAAQAAVESAQVQSIEKAAKELSPPARRGARAASPEEPAPDENPFGPHYLTFFGPKKISPEQNLTLPKLLPEVTHLIALKVAHDADMARARKPRMPLPQFLCAHYLRDAGLRSKARKSLATLLHAAKLHALGNVRAKLFAEAAGLLAFQYDEPTCELLFHTVVVLYGESKEQVLHHLSLPPNQLQLHLTRDDADAARVMAGPIMAAGGVQRSWGSVEELLEGTRLPEALRDEVTKKAAQRATPMHMDEATRKAAIAQMAAGAAGAGAMGVEDELGVDTDEVLSLVLQARRRAAPRRPAPPRAAPRRAACPALPTAADRPNHARRAPCGRRGAPSGSSSSRCSRSASTRPTGTATRCSASTSSGTACRRCPSRPRPSSRPPPPTAPPPPPPRPSARSPAARSTARAPRACSTRCCSSRSGSARAAARATR